MGARKSTCRERLVTMAIQGLSMLWKKLELVMVKPTSGNITIMKRMVELNPHIRSCGISFVENYYPQKGRWFCPYAVRRDSTTIETRSVGDAKHNYLTAEWFTTALASEEGYWSKPFFDGTDKTTPLVSHLFPICDKQGRKVAVLGVDLMLEQLNSDSNNRFEFFYNRRGYSSRKPKQENGADSSVEDTDSSFDVSKSIYYFIINKDGTYIMHPDLKRIVNENYITNAEATPDSLDDYLGHQMAEGFEGHFGDGPGDQQLVIEGEKVFVSYMPLEHTDWSMCFVVPNLYFNIFGYVVGGMLVFFILMALLVILFVGRFLIKRAVRPVRQLAVSANEVAKGNFNAPLPRLKSHDEIHLLRDSFDKMQHSLTNYVEQLKATTAQKASIESELKIAHDIQMSMLPKTYPPFPERRDIDVYGMLKPAKGVGGDLFDFYIRDERLFFCIGDVSGKGIPAALFMTVTRSLFRNVSSYTSDPSAIVYALNKTLADGNETNMFVTIFVGVLNLQTGILHYCNGGHDAPMLIGRDVGVLPCNSNLPLGVISDFKFSMQEISIDPGTTIFLYTDGLNEAEDSSHAQFGDARIMNVAKRLLADNQHQPQNTIDAMNKAVQNFVGDAEQSDDLTMLAIRLVR